jgi:hypothetical protein
LGMAESTTSAVPRELTQSACGFAAADLDARFARHAPF